METTVMADELREKIIANPDVLLEDVDVMRALVGANDENQGGNVVDLRAIAMDRLTARFDRLDFLHSEPFEISPERGENSKVEASLFGIPKTVYH